MELHLFFLVFLVIRPKGEVSPRLQDVSSTSGQRFPKAASQVADVPNTVGERTTATQAEVGSGAGEIPNPFSLG